MIKLTKIHDVAIVVYPDNVIGLSFKEPPLNGDIRMELNQLESYAGIEVYKNSDYDDEHFTPEVKDVLRDILLDDIDTNEHLKEWTIEVSPIYDIDELVTGLVEMFTKYNLSSVVRYHNKPDDNNQVVPVLV